MIDKKIARLRSAQIAAEEAIQDRLKELFPRGSLISFNIMFGQKRPSTGLVHRHDARCGGSVQVLHLQAKEHSRYKYRTIPLSEIIELLS